jgi:hypothetical protein
VSESEPSEHEVRFLRCFVATLGEHGIDDAGFVVEVLLHLVSERCVDWGSLDTACLAVSRRTSPPASPSPSPPFDFQTGQANSLPVRFGLVLHEHGILASGLVGEALLELVRGNVVSWKQLGDACFAVSQRRSRAT